MHLELIFEENFTLLFLKEKKAGQFHPDQH